MLQKARFLPAVLMMSIIFLLSHQPGDELELPFFIPHLDKIGHFIVYGLLAFACLHGLRPFRHAKIPLVWLNLGVVGFCCLYGISDEFHQTFIDGRTASVLDLLADTVGATAAVTSASLWWRKKTTKQGDMNAYL